MYSVGVPEFEHLSINTSQVRGDRYLCLQLSRQLGAKRFSIGKETKPNSDKALQIAYTVEDYCKNQISKSEPVNLEDIRKIVEGLKKPHLKVVSSTSIRFIWDRYVAFHKSLGCWSETYLLTHIQTVGNLVNRPDFPQEIEKPSEVLQWLLNGNRSSGTAKDRFKVIVTAIDWGSKNDIVERKYGLKYRDCLNSLSLKLQQSSGDDETNLEDEIDPFSKEEINLILEVFKTDSLSRFKGKHSQYYPFLKFLWLTGCRPSEAVALKWDNVKDGKNLIRFCEGEVIASGKRVKRKRTKTQRFRNFPINSELRELIESLQKNSDYVFIRNDGTPIHLHTLNGIWKRLFPKLEIRYRVPYQFRHSMISYHANRGFPLTQLAEIVGNSEKVIRDHYLKVGITLINVPTIN